METISQQEGLTAQAFIDALPAVALQHSNPLILQINKKLWRVKSFKKKKKKLHPEQLLAACENAGCAETAPIAN